MKDLDKVCCVLDKLTLDTLTLMEQHIQNKLQVEQSMSNGNDHLAKSRYIMGHNSVSQYQIPLESTDDIDPITTVSSAKNDRLFSSPELHLDIERDSSTVNPKKWFGLFVPQTMNFAQAAYQRTLQLIVQSANVQRQLHENVTKIHQLKVLKKTMKIEE